MLRQRLACRLAEACDDVDHAVRNPGFLDQLRKAESGVCSAGLSMIVQPAASAGAIFQAAIISGKFQGIIWPTTPTGSRSV
jgi:hypothetical protein